MAKYIMALDAGTTSNRCILFDEKGEKHGEQLFWIPASHPYYKIPANNMFAKNHDFSKVLVFSAWEMVPRMIACMISYAVEQKSISRAFPSATYTKPLFSSSSFSLWIASPPDIISKVPSAIRTLSLPENPCFSAVIQ